MRSLVRRAIITTVGLAAGVVVWAGCSAKQQTEYVTGISTQVTVPRDLKSVLVEVSIGGVQQFCRAYKVYDGKVQLPRSLGTYALNTPNASGPITYTIIGISEEFNESSGNPLFDGTCTQLQIGQNSARILRRSRQPYVPEEILFLPMPLKYSCYDKNCGADETCKGGKCVSATVTDPAATFPRYTPELLDGTGGTCFHVNAFKAPDGKTEIPGCMTGAVPPIVVDPVTCTYAVPNTPDAPAALPGLPNPFGGAASGQGVNVQVSYDGLTKEVLDADPEEGFFIPDPTKPQEFRLAPGLCDMARQKDADHTIASILVSGTCQSKKGGQPLCLADQLAAMGVDGNGLTSTPPPPDVTLNKRLDPKPRSLFFVIDDSAHGASFATAMKKKVDAASVLDGGTTNDDDIIGASVDAALTAPQLWTTTFGVFYSSQQAACTPAVADPTIGIATLPPERATAAFAEVRDHVVSASTESKLAAGLAGAYAELRKPEHAADVSRNVVLISNNFADEGASSACAATPLVPLVKSASDDGIKTYAMQLVKDPAFVPINDTTHPAYKIAQAGGGGKPPAYKVAKKDGDPDGSYYASQLFTEIFKDLSACVFQVDVPAASGGTLDATERVVFEDFVTGKERTDLGTATSHAAACDAANANRTAGVSGWGFKAPAASGEKTEVYLCGSLCGAYQDEAAKTFGIGSIFGTASSPVPLYIRRSK